MIEVLIAAGFTKERLKGLWLIYDDMCHWWRYGSRVMFLPFCLWLTYYRALLICSFLKKRANRDPEEVGPDEPVVQRDERLLWFLYKWADDMGKVDRVHFKGHLKVSVCTSSSVRSADICTRHPRSLHAPLTTLS